MAESQDFPLPDLGEGLEEAEIVHWLVEVGDHVDLNQDIVEVETAKALVTVPSPLAGTVEALGGAPGSVVAVGSMLLRVRLDGAPAAANGASPAPTVSAPSEEAASDAEPQPLVGYGREKGAATRRRRTSRGGGSQSTPAQPTPTHDAVPTADGGAALASSVRATPLVRRLAKDLGVDLARIPRGTGRDGALTREDVRAAAGIAEEAHDSTAASDARGAVLPREGQVRPDVPGFRGRYPGEVEVVAGVRRRIIEKMERSRRDIPSATISRDADLTALKSLRRELQAQAADFDQEIRVTGLHVIMRAVVVALRRFPVLNARYDEAAGTIELLEDINLGFAVDSPRGLLVPNIKQAQEFSIAGFATGVAELAGRARTGRITPSDLLGGTFTVNNYGAFGNDDGDAIINHPEVGILGVGVARRRPWVITGEDGVERVEIRDIARFTLAFDHRVCDGGEAGRFVTMVADLCERPERLLYF